MTFLQFYSGSAANLYVVEGKEARLLIDPGVAWSKIQGALNYDLSGIGASLWSHEHNDHSRAVKDVLRAGIDVYSSRFSFAAVGVGPHRRVQPVEPGTTFRVPGYTVYPFRTWHDAKEPLGFVIVEDATGERLLFATDTSHLTQRFKFPFDIIAIEVSYDRAVLRERVESGDINESLAKRLLLSHQDKQVAMTYLRQYVDLSRCRELHLLHLSRDNLDARRVRQEFENELFIETRIV
jgi:phosphoribosyl 1,2-cyclic phosphodiesterase